MRFMMQFPNRFKAAIPCCAMDPIVPIHKVVEQYEGQFADDLEKAFQGQVYKWNGTDMVLSDIDTPAFVNLPMFFVHAETDSTCKLAHFSWGPLLDDYAEGSPLSWMISQF